MMVHGYCKNQLIHGDRYIQSLESKELFIILGRTLATWSFFFLLAGAA